MTTRKHGSIAHKALQHLQSLPEGTELSSAALAAVLCIRSGAMNGALRHYVKDGTLTQRTVYPPERKRKAVLWKLGSIDAPDLEAELPSQQRVIPAAGAPPILTAAVRSVFELGGVA